MHAGADDYHVGGAYQILEKHIKSAEDLQKILMAQRDGSAAYRLRREAALMGWMAREEIRRLIPGMEGQFVGGLYTANDGMAHPLKTTVPSANLIWREIIDSLPSPRFAHGP